VISHIVLLVVFALLVSTVFATLLRDDPRSQLRTGAILFAVFVGGAFIAGWLMFPLPL
jgi:heme A synthase